MALIRQADKLAQEHTERAIETIAGIMNDTFAEDRDRLSAANSILDRGHGKPVSATIQLPVSRQQALALANMSDAELLEGIGAAELPRLAAPIRTVAKAHDPLLD
jgi:hypothetical protein